MTASVLPEFWRAFRPRPPRPPIDWRSVGTTAALTVSAASLVWTGATLIGVGETRLGLAMLAAGTATLVAASAVRW
jgi:hypothetical protein